MGTQSPQTPCKGARHLDPIYDGAIMQNVMAPSIIAGPGDHAPGRAFYSLAGPEVCGVSRLERQGGVK